MRLALALLFVLFVPAFALMLPAAAQSSARDTDVEHRPFQVGAVNYFGYGGLSLHPIQKNLPIHVGDTVTVATFSKKPISDAILRSTGKMSTDINVTCCDAAGRLLIFIGLDGSTSRTLATIPAPTGNDRLDPPGLGLYDHAMDALQAAVARGAAGEDDSHGYMISNDPALRAINLEVLAYAQNRETDIIRVLQHAADPHQRRAAAALLGYVKRSPTQIQALAQAMSDPDQEVRNNAVRSLEVLMVAPGATGLPINIEPAIGLLYSGKWTDRNKASLLLLRLTKARSPQILDPLRREAVPALTEGALWKDDLGHSLPFLAILGRIGSIPDDKLEQLIKNNEVEAVLSSLGVPGKR